MLEVDGERTFELVYLVKVLRLYHGFKFLNYKNYIKQLKELQLKKIQKTDQIKVTKDEDQVKISQLYLMAQVLKTTQLIIILGCISFITGILWYILCQNQGDTAENFLEVFEVD